MSKKFKSTNSIRSSRRASGESTHSMQTRSQSLSSEMLMEMTSAAPSDVRKKPRHPQRSAHEKLEEDLWKAQLATTVAQLNQIKEQQQQHAPQLPYPDPRYKSSHRRHRSGHYTSKDFVFPPDPRHNFALNLLTSLIGLLCLPLWAAWLVVTAVSKIIMLISQLLLCYIVLVLCLSTFIALVIFMPFWPVAIPVLLGLLTSLWWIGFWLCVVLAVFALLYWLCKSPDLAEVGRIWIDAGPVRLQRRL